MLPFAQIILIRTFSCSTVNFLFLCLKVCSFNRICSFLVCTKCKTIISRSCHIIFSLHREFFLINYVYVRNEPKLKIATSTSFYQISLRSRILRLKKNCVKIVRIRSYFDPHFPAFGLNTDQNNSETDTFYAVNYKQYRQIKT